MLNAAGRGLCRTLCAASGSGKDRRQWVATHLTEFLKDAGKDLEIPPEFPRWEHVQDYLNQIPSTRESLLKLPQSLEPSPNEHALFSFLVDKF